MEPLFLRVRQTRVEHSFRLPLYQFQEVDKYSQAVNALWYAADQSIKCVLLSPGDSGDRLSPPSWLPQFLYKFRNTYIFKKEKK